MGTPGVAYLPGRECGACTLCCKVLGIVEVESPQGKWCRHCAIGEGCRIYDLRPAPCREFACGYLVWDAVPAHWFPAISKIVIVSELGFRINFYVDADRPGRWREAPYYADIKRLAALALADNRQVLVTAGAHVFAIFPERDVDLGVVGADEQVVTGTRPDGTWGAAKVRNDDPLLLPRDGRPGGAFIALA